MRLRTLACVLALTVLPACSESDPTGPDPTGQSADLVDLISNGTTAAAAATHWRQSAGPNAIGIYDDGTMAFVWAGSSSGTCTWVKNGPSSVVFGANCNQPGGTWTSMNVLSGSRESGSFLANILLGSSNSIGLEFIVAGGPPS